MIERLATDEKLLCQVFAMRDREPTDASDSATIVAHDPPSRGRDGVYDYLRHYGKLDDKMTRDVRAWADKIDPSMPNLSPA